MSSVDFATFCYFGDKHRLHASGQFRRQVMSNCYPFNKLIVVYQSCQPTEELEDLGIELLQSLILGEHHIDKIIKSYGIDLDKPQYESSTDKHHTWKVHTVNHLYAASVSQADYIVFADNDCWMKSQPCFKNKDLYSWIEVGIHILEDLRPNCFIVSPGDGEGERTTLRMSQQFFLVKREDFVNADWNQPNWDGNVNIPGGPFPQYFSLLEGRMEIYCKSVGKFRYVLSNEYRYWHHNRLTKDDLYELDYSKY